MTTEPNWRQALARVTCARPSVRRAARPTTVFRRVSPAPFKQVVESRGTERVGLSPVQRCNCLFYICARYLRPEVFGH
jgi:hypothetical protein